MNFDWRQYAQQIFHIPGYFASIIVYGISAAVIAGVALLWSKHPGRWIVALLVIGLGVGLFYDRPPREMKEGLPETFVNYFTLWVFVLGVAAILTTSHLVGTLVREHWGGKGEETTSEHPDIDAAWQEVQIQMSRARIDLSEQAVYILLSPEESLAASMIGAAGLQLFARAPVAPDAPLHGYAIADALFLSCAGMYAAARPPTEEKAEPSPQDGTARLEHLCRLIAAANPERPNLRGIAVLIPYEWTRSNDSLLKVSAIRDDLQTIRQVFKLRCPTVTVFCMRESLPGFSEFTTRLPARERRQMRCGFSAPVSHSRDVFRRGMDWMTRWFELWSLNLMVGDVQNTRGNARLLAMTMALRENRDNLVGLLESALTVHLQAEPLLYRGSYFVGISSEPDRNAFSAGLLKGRLLLDKNLTQWARDADRVDRRYRLASLALGIVIGGGSLWIWVSGIILRLEDLGGWMWAAIAGLGLLVLLWAGAFLAPLLKRLFARRS